MTKRNKTKGTARLARAEKNIKVVPIITKCNCGDAIADTVNGSIGCIRYPECCDEDLEFL
jgi:hypothetical protein